MFYKTVLLNLNSNMSMFAAEMLKLVVTFQSDQTMNKKNPHSPIANSFSTRNSKKNLIPYEYMYLFVKMPQLVMRFPSFLYWCEGKCFCLGYTYRQITHIGKSDQGILY